MKTKQLIIAAMFTTLTAGYSQAQHALHRLWETEATLPVPESVLFDAKDKLLFVAQIDGKAGEKDGKGGIGKVGLDGKIIDKDWVTGLNAPKGMGRYGNKLFVADITAVVEIDIKSGKVIKTHEIEGSKFLNDITIDKKGTVFVSDSDMKKVFSLKDGKASLIFDDLTRPNGLLAVSDGLLIADNGALKKLGKDNKITTIADGMLPSTDGIEEVKSGEYVVSCWAGTVYYVTAKGAEKLLDTTAEKINAADIGYDPAKRIVYIPTFMKNSITAYHLK